MCFRPKKRQPMWHSDPKNVNQYVIQTPTKSTNVLFRPQKRQQMCYSDPKTSTKVLFRLQTVNKCATQTPKHVLIIICTVYFAFEYSKFPGGYYFYYVDQWT